VLFSGTLLASQPTSVFAQNTQASPAAFGKVSPTNGTTGASLILTLTWAASSGATSYQYCYDTTNDYACGGTWTNAGTATHGYAMSLSMNTTYYWQARAVNSSGTTYADGSASAWWHFTTKGAPGAFGKTTPANAATGASLNLTLSWAAASGATSYQYCYDITNDNACSSWTNAGSATHGYAMSLSMNTTYYWQARAVNANGTTYADSSATTWWHFTTKGAPGAFGKTTPANAATGTSLNLTLSWTASSGATSYEYCYDTSNDSACGGSWTSAGTATHGYAMNLNNSTTYYWQARAVNTNGTTYADASAWWHFTTKGPPTIATVSTGGYHTCGLISGGSVKCWGDNEEGQLGDNTTTQRPTPVGVSGLTSGIQAISAGGYHTCALTSAGGVKCWGDNFFGELGDNSTTNRWTPVDVNGLNSGIKAISAGGYHTCALTTAGGVKCWGYNVDGELGDSTTTQRLTPVDVNGLTSGVKAIFAGFQHTCALTTTGGVRCWGKNNYSQLGDNTTTDRYAPVDVTGLNSGVTVVTTGGWHTCALTTAGAVKCWGDNDNGQLGDNTTTNRLTPVAVSGLSSGVTGISSGLNHTCALTSAGGAMCWGYNYSGQLGDNTTTNQLTPVNVSGLSSGSKAISAGWFHTCTLTNTGAVMCWGRNNHGQLGDNTLTERHTPVSVVWP